MRKRWLLLIPLVLLIAGVPTINNGPDMAPGAVVGLLSADSVLIQRNADTVAVIYGPWEKDMATVRDIIGSRKLIEDVEHYGINMTAFYRLGDEDLYLAWVDPEISKLPNGNYNYLYRYITDEQNFSITAGTIKKNGDEVTFIRGGRKKSK